MSHSTYNKVWAEAQKELEDNLLPEELSAQVLRPEKDRVVFVQRLATLFVGYVQVFRQLEEAYDQVVHPQKRRLIREVLDGVMGRLIELKSEMVEKELSEYHYMDDVIQDLNLTPMDIEIPVPQYFLSERRKVLQERREMLSSILSTMGVEERPKVDVQPVTARVLNIEEAIKIIQVTERARQGRLRAKFMREIQQAEERQKRAKDVDRGPAALNQAAVRIQKVWRGFQQRTKTRKERDEEMIFLGMVLDPDHSQPCSSILVAKANQAKRRGKQEEYEEDFQKSFISVTEKLREMEGPDMRESLKDQIRQWFIECYDAAGSFPDYPEEEDGGSALIFSDKNPEELLETASKVEVDTNKKDVKKDTGKKDKGDEELESGLKMAPSAFLSDLERGCKTFTDVWQNRNESQNFSQRHEIELIKEDKRKEIESEIRVQVDELMRQELATWKLALEKGKGGKAKGAAKKKKGPKNGKKKKKEKDLTADRTTDSLFQELVEQALVKQPENVRLEDYLGDYSYLGTTLRQTDIEPMPSLSDLRQLITLYAILPLGSQKVHEKAPLVKAILLAGPNGVGKKMLVHAICQETGATLFDLSPVNLVGKYPGKSGLQMLLHMVFKVAKLMQPSIIWIGDAEKMFYKKVPKEEKELDPTRLKKDLPKMLKTMKGGDCVLIVGTTQYPFNADIKSFCKLYGKIILIPRPDYASRYVMWRQLIEKNGGQVTSALDLSSLAKISDGYTQGHMAQAVRTILSEARKQQLAKRPLTAAEFIAPLAKMDPIFKDEEEAFKNWYAKTPLGKKRAKAALGKEAEEETPGKAGKGGKKKGVK
ncbi:dynein regulatory complex protein 11 [Scleropages formosus]|uniref:dynein regulatory complex protein 11 n=1 Tax=Scleropages formosus TaxID=113540 RepID=UPI0008791A1A|nr:dynein regulatory complex protein 11 [Scleropages formosus]